MKNYKSLFNTVLFIAFLTTESIFANRQTTNSMPKGLKNQNGMDYEVALTYYGIGHDNRESISIGSKKEHSEEYSISIGNENSSEGYGSISQGYKLKSDGYASISLGYEAEARANHSIAHGHKAQADGGVSISIGRHSKAKQAYSISIGDEAQATLENSVAIGSGSITKNAINTSEVIVENIKYNGFAGIRPNSVVSIGKSGQERQLQYVSAGQISTTSTDAVNGSQLYSTNKVLGDFANSVKNVFGSSSNLDTNAKITITNIGGTNKNTVHDAIKEIFDKNKETSEKLEKLSKNTLSISGDTGTTEKQELNKSDGLSFKIKGSEYIRTKASGNEVSVDLSDKIKKDIGKGVIANSGVANAVAMANLSQVSGNNHNIVGSYGYFNGDHAFALGFSGSNDIVNLVYRASGALNTKGYLSVGAGIGYQFGSYSSNVKDTDTIMNSYSEKLNYLNDLLNEQNHKFNTQNSNLCKEIEDLNQKLKNIKVNEDDLYILNGYNLGVSELTSSQIDRLKNIVEDLNTNCKNRKIYITGYTDNVSNERINLELGLKRAKKVAKKLVELGLDMSISIRKVSSSGYNNIIETNKNSNGRYLNRRVEIELR
ncbi:OmpA family protein [Streptobacillus ratti]|uniref:OmpA family protein n=1 Tax=Streptobacillus ratti TaxID=1720557 RepID=UPI00093555CC|nr:OmpA family protein [Streptobacillus ratti]